MELIYFLEIVKAFDVGDVIEFTITSEIYLYVQFSGVIIQNTKDLLVVLVIESKSENKQIYNLSMFSKITFTVIRGYKTSLMIKIDSQMRRDFGSRRMTIKKMNL